MTATFQIVLLLLAVLATVAVLARRLAITPSILLVAAGVVLALIPGLPDITLAPEIVLLVILPPLIYWAGVSMSWREFRFNLRPITLLAVGCVVFTTCAVAAATHALLGFGWAVGFLLGAIVAPPDVIAPLAVARSLGLPRRLLVVLEGEGLANDATALILYRFAVAAIVTGGFSLSQAAGTFALICVGEIAYGIGIGWLSLRLRQWAHDPRVEITLSLMTPYLAYWLPEYLGGSGVLATVAAGLYVSWNGPLLISAATRLQGIFFWDLFIYLIEGLVFLLTGLQARTMLYEANGVSVSEILLAVGVTTAIVIAARFVWVFPAVYLPRWLIPPLARRDPSPPWTWVAVLAFVGVRGVVSLAAALAVPFTLANGAPFPHRQVIVIVSFGVIVVTLIGLGSLLPMLIRWLDLGHHGIEERQHEAAAELAARLEAIDVADLRLQEIAAERHLAPEAAALLSAHNAQRRQLFPRHAADGTDIPALDATVRRELIAAERAHLHGLLRKGKITDESRRRIERELDLEEATLAGHADDAPPL